MELQKKTYILVGGTGGIGLGLAKKLLGIGVEKIAIFDLCDSRNAIDQLKTEFPTKTVLFYKADVTKKMEIEDAYDKTVKEFGYVDVVINGAGIVKESSVEDTMHVNLFGVIYGTQVALDHMAIEKGGRGGMIVNVASICGFDYFFNIPAYVASKHAVVGYTRCLADENFAPVYGVKFVTICPGVTDTRLIHDFNKIIYDSKFLDETVAHFNESGYQTVEACAESFVYALKHSENGSVWMLDNAKCYTVKLPTKQDFIIN